MRLPALQLTPHGRYLIPHQPTDGTRAQRDADAGYDVQQVLEFLGRPTSNVARDASVCASKRRRTGGGWTIDLADTLLLAGRNQQRGLEFRFLLGIAAPYLVTGQSSEPEQVPEEFNKGMEVGQLELEKKKPATVEDVPPPPPPPAQEQRAGGARALAKRIDLRRGRSLVPFLLAYRLTDRCAAMDDSAGRRTSPDALLNRELG